MASRKSCKFELSCKFKVFCDGSKFQEVKRKCEDLNIKAVYSEQIDEDIYWIKSSSLSKDLILKCFDVFEDLEINCYNASSKDSNEDVYGNDAESSHNSNQPKHTKTSVGNKFQEKGEQQDNLSKHEMTDFAQGEMGEEDDDLNERVDEMGSSEGIEEKNEKREKQTVKIKSEESRAVLAKNDKRSAKPEDIEDQPYENSEKEKERKQNSSRDHAQNRKVETKIVGGKTNDTKSNKHGNHADTQKREAGERRKVGGDKKEKRDDDNNDEDEDEDDGDDADNCEKEKDQASILFLIGEHELALKLLATSKSIGYLRKPYRDNSSIIIQVDDQECVKELNEFKNQVKQIKVPLESLTEVINCYSSETHIEHLDGYGLVTALKPIYNEIKSKFSDLYPNKTICSGSVGPTSRRDMKDKDRRLSVPSGLEKPTKESRFEGHYSPQLIVKVLKTDITQLEIDVIVNAANGGLKHGGGVANVIAKAAGKKLLAECEDHIDQNGKICVSYHFASTGGNLRAKQVYHAVGPRWSEYPNKEDECKQALTHTILRCLLHADKEGHHSIAFPSISAAIFKVPLPICVESYLKAVRHYEELLQDAGKLKRIYFVDIKDDMVNAIQEYFASYWDLDPSGHELKVDRGIMDENFTKNKKSIKGDKQRPKGHGSYSKTGESTHSSGYGSYSKTGESTHSSGHERSSPTSYAGIVSSKSHGHSSPSSSVDKASSKTIGSPPPYGQIYPSVPSSSQSEKAVSKSESTGCSGIPTGDMPHGRMEVRMKRDHYHRDYFEIVYTFYQFPDSVTANIPSGRDGMHMLYLLMVAFYKRLTLIRDTSMTTRYHWNSIHDAAICYDILDPKHCQQLLRELQRRDVCHENMTDDDQSTINRHLQNLYKNRYVMLYSM